MEAGSINEPQGWQGRDNKGQEAQAVYLEHSATAEDIQLIHVRVVVAVVATSFVLLAQIFALVGSGLLAPSTATYLGDVSKASWFSTCITIGTLATVPPVSQAADYWGRKWLLISSVHFAMAGALIVSRAQTIGTAIAGFSILSLGYGSQSLIYSVCSEILPRQYRAHGQAAVNVASGLGGVLGVLVGTTLLKHGNAENFRTYWYITTAIFGIGGAGLFFGYNPPSRHLQTSFTTLTKISSMDWIGILLLTTGLVLFCVGLQWSSTEYGWTDPETLAPFVIGIVLLISFEIYGWRFKRDGLLHHALFGSRNFAIATILVFCEGSSFLTTNSYFIFEINLIQQKNLFDAGLPFVIVFVAACVSSFLAGAYTTWTKRIREVLILGFSFLVIFNSVMAVYEHTDAYAHVWGYAVFAGFGLGFLLTDAYVAAQLNTPPDLISTTSGLVTSARSVGGTVGLAVNNAIFSSTLSSNLAPKVAALVLPLGFPPEELGDLIVALTSGNPRTIAAVPNATPEILTAGGLAMIKAYELEFRNTWIAAACFAATGTILACFVFDPKQELNHEVDAPMPRK